MLQNLSFAAVVIGAFRVKSPFASDQSSTDWLFWYDNHLVIREREREREREGGVDLLLLNDFIYSIS